MSEVWIVIIPTIGVPIIWAVIVWYRSRAEAHIRIYRDNLNELDKYGWVRVDIELTTFQILGLNGWGIRITNNKSIPLENVSLWYISNREGQRETKIEPKERLGYIDERSEIIKFESANLEPKENRIFVVAGEDTGFGASYLRAEKTKYRVAGWDFTVDIEIMAKTIIYYDLPTRHIRLNIEPDGTVSVRKSF